MEKIYLTLDKFFADISTEILTLSEDEIDQKFSDFYESIDDSERCNELGILEDLQVMAEKKLLAIGKLSIKNMIGLLLNML